MKKRLVIVTVLVMMIAANANASYFYTDRSKDIIGAFLTDPSQVHEVKNFSNAFGAIPKTFSGITTYLNVNNNKMLPVIGIDKLLFDPDIGMYHHDVSLIINAIENSGVHQREILFLMDEPLWAIRRACEKNKPEACQDIANRYAETLSTMRVIGQLLREHCPECGILHIEAWAELVMQKNEHPYDNVIMLDDAEYLGFNCYGNFNYCGSKKHGYQSQLVYGTWVWDAMLDLEFANPIGRKMFLVPGAFLADGHFSYAEEIFHQVSSHTWFLDNTELIGGLGVFLWGDLEENNHMYYGARGMKSVNDFIQSTLRSRK